MNILYIARKFPPSVGGMERFAYDLANALEVNNKLVKITWGGANKWLPVVLPWFFIRGVWILATQPIDVIHMQDGVQAPVGWLLSKLFNKPYIIVAHGLDITYKNRFYQLVNMMFVRSASAVVAISTATMQEAIARGVSAEKTSVVPLGMNDDYGTPTPNRQDLESHIKAKLENKLILLTIGRLVKRKGVAWFIDRVLPLVIARYQNVLYIVAGDGEERTRIEEVIARSNLSKHVMLLGKISDTTRSLLYQSSDVFVMPNIVVPGDMEGFGIVAQEAATAGLPVLASDIEGIKDAIKNGRNGILVESGDEAIFVSEISRLLDSRSLRTDLGKKAREYTLKNYKWSTIADKYNDIYHKITKK